MNPLQRQIELERAARRFAFYMDRNPGETVASLHRRKANIMRKAGLHVFDYPMDLDSGKNCMICWFGVELYTGLAIETDTGKISGVICEKCLKALTEKLDKVFEKRLEKKRKKENEK